MEQEKLRAVQVHDEQARLFGDRYAEMARDPYASTFAYGRQKIENVLESHLTTCPSGRALDVGCGTGFNVGKLVRRGFDTVGIEPALQMRLQAQHDHPQARFLAGDIEALPFPDAAFDLVISIEVLRYLRHPSRAVSECRRVLRPGGIAFLTAAPLWSLNGYFLVNQLTSRVSIPTATRVRQHFQSSSGARRMMLASGFTNVEVHGAFLGPWHVLQRLSPRATRGVLRMFERIDDKLSDQRVFRDLSNHLILIGRAP